jgi:predicted small metal-binding protein
MFSLSCRDMGMDCDFVADGASKEEVMQKAMQHSMQAHGMSEADMTPDMKEKAMSMMKEA